MCGHLNYIFTMRWNHKFNEWISTCILNDTNSRWLHFCECVTRALPVFMVVKYIISHFLFKLTAWWCVCGDKSKIFIAHKKTERMERKLKTKNHPPSQRSQAIRHHRIFGTSQETYHQILCLHSKKIAAAVAMVKPDFKWAPLMPQIAATPPHKLSAW